MTIASGFAQYPILPFILLSFIARGMRFYLVAFLIHRYGERARAIIEKRLELWATICARSCWWSELSRGLPVSDRHLDAGSHFRHVRGIV